MKKHIYIYISTRINNKLSKIWLSISLWTKSKPYSKMLEQKLRWAIVQRNKLRGKSQNIVPLKV